MKRINKGHKHFLVNYMGYDKDGGLIFNSTTIKTNNREMTISTYEEIKNVLTDEVGMKSFVLISVLDLGITKSY